MRCWHLWAVQPDGPEEIVHSCNSVSTNNDAVNGNDLFWQYASFVHEFGHILGLDHGGGDGFNDKPNYPSLMNYAYDYEFRNNVHRIAGTLIQYSTGQFRDVPRPGGLDENHLCEVFGLGTGSDTGIDFLHSYFQVGNTSLPGYVLGAVDWSQSWGFEDSCRNNPGAGGVRADVNGDNDFTFLNDYNDWDLISQRMWEGLHDDQCSRFGAGYCSSALAIDKVFDCTIR